MGQSITISELVDWLFSQPPFEPCTYNIFWGNTHLVSPEIMFPTLMSIFINGAKKLYGDDITPSKISDKQFNNIKSYILSIGFQVKHSFTYIYDKTLINIWFEPFTLIKNCKGYLRY